jgi:uncharacterized protein Usg
MQKEMARQLDGWRMTTAEILYHMPDHPGILQSFIWQKLDFPPEFPKLHGFLDFWTENLDSPLHSVRVGHVEIITPPKLSTVEASFQIH